MRHLKEITFLSIMIICLVFCTGCNRYKQNIVFEIEESKVVLNVGDKYTPKLVIDNIRKYELQYTYDDTIIKIENGTIYTLSEGNCEVYISIKNKEYVKPVILKISVMEIEPDEIISEEQVKLFISDTYQLKPSVEPLNASNEFTYSSNNEEIAEVSDDGIIKGIAEGETHIVIKSKKFPNVKTRVLVIVEKPPVENIETIESISLNYNQTYQLTWKVFPTYAEQEVIFSSSDESVAFVDNKGMITAYKYGETIIKITSIKDSSKYAEVLVVVDGDKATDIIIDEKKINMKLGEEYQLDYFVTPSTAYQGVDIIINDEEGLEINNDILFAKKTGTYEITLNTIDNSNIKKIVYVNIVGKDIPIFVTNSKFDEQSELIWNENFDPLDNIRAVDDKDGDITNKIVVTGVVDNKRYGAYTLKYSIEDSDGNTQILIRDVKVIWGYGVTVIGHAGSYYGVPNSEEAILYAAEVLKYPAIEIDLKQTKDGVFVLSHDPNWGDAILEDTNYEDLKNVEYTVTKKAGVVETTLTDAQRTYTAKICTFERYLEICKEYNIIAVIELKTSAGISNWTEANAPQTSRMPKIMELIKKHDMLDSVIFLSSQELCLNWVKTNGYEYIPCQYLTLSSCENEKTYNIVKQYKLDISFNVRDGIKISDEWLEKYRELGCKLAVFTFEEWAHYKDIQEWINRGVDFVTTDWHVLEKLDLSNTKE